jgi:type II secretory pathway pseudopilin PulG
MQQQKQSGFSLFEITFVIVLTCLLATIMVIGQNFTISSKVNLLKQDFNRLQTVLYETQIDLSPKQGNFHEASLHSQNATATSNNSNRKNILGNWKSASGEIFNLWQNALPADPAKGTVNSSTYIPLVPSGNNFGFPEVARAPIAGLISNYIICTNNIEGRLVKQLDMVMDNGNTASGPMMASRTVGGAGIATDNIISGSTYMVCLGV